MKSTKSIIKNFVAWISATAIPILGFLSTEHRTIDIGWEFFIHEMNAHVLEVVAIILGMFILTILYHKYKLKSPFLLELLARLSQLNVRFPSLALVGLILLVLSFQPYVATRYKIYSETYYQISVIHLMQEGKIRQARIMCERYLTMYPQRQKEGAIPDPTCLPLTTFLNRMARVDDYLKHVRFEPAVIDGLGIPVEWNAKRFARLLTDKWSGRENLRFEDYNVSAIPLPIPNKLFE